MTDLSLSGPQRRPAWHRSAFSFSWRTPKRTISKASQGLAASALMVAALAVAPSASLSAQGKHAEHKYGGFVNAVWLERTPLLSGDPDGFKVWTAEDGSRIRVYDSVSDSLTEMNVVSAAPQTLHDIYLDQFVEDGAERIFGIAVGTGGEAVWWDNAGHFLWKPFVTPPAPGKELWACAVEHQPLGTTVWVCGEDHVLKCAQPPFAAWSDATWPGGAPAPNAALTALDFADWSLPGKNGVVGTNSGELFFTTDGMTFFPGVINDLPTPPPLPAPQVPVFWDIDFRPGSATEAIAVGGWVEGNGEGFAWRTTDGGQTWDRVLTQLDKLGYTRVPQTSVKPGHPCTNVPGLVGGKHTRNVFATLYGVHMRQNGQAIMVAYGGQVWRYKPNVDCAADISDTAEFATSPLWGCHGDGQREIWLSGQFGLLRRTSDGGKNFEAVTPNNSSRFRSLAFPTNDVGYRGGQSMRLQKTTNGGKTWVDQLAYESGVNLGPGIESMAAYGVDQVVAIANNFNDGADPVAFTTNDGGQTCWGVVDMAAFIDESQGAVQLLDVAAGGLDGVTGLPTFYASCSTTPAWGGLMRSIDGGLTWSELPSPASSLSDAFAWNGVAALGTTAVALVGRNLTTGKMAAYLTVNAGNPNPAWTDLFVNAPNGRLDGVAVNGATVIAVGNNGRIYELDSATAQLVRAQGSIGLTTKNLRCVRMGFDGTIIWAYASGDGGTLLRSALTSGQWEALHAGTTDDLTGLDLRVDTQGSIDAWLTGRNARWGDSTMIRVR